MNNVPKWLLVVAYVFVIVWILSWLIPDETTSPPRDSCSAMACRQFATIARDARAGVLTDTELRVALRKVYDHARCATTPGVEEQARAMLAGATQGDADALQQATPKFDALCGALP